MLREMSRIELALWFAHVRVGSLDDEATDVRFAMVAAAARNAPHFRREDRKPFTVRDFLPDPPGELAAKKVEQDIKAFFVPRMKKDS